MVNVLGETNLKGKGELVFRALLTLSLLLGCLALPAQKQLSRHFQGAMASYVLKEAGMSFQVIDLDLSRAQIRARYFGSDAKRKYREWERVARPQVICLLAVGFARDWEPELPPLGWSLENGQLLNRALEAEMDGLLVLDRRGQLKGYDLSQERVLGRYAVRQASERAACLQALASGGHSAFQTQLMYSHLSGEMMGEEKYGSRAARRFLALCEDAQGKSHQLVLSLLAAKHLNQAAKAALTALQAQGYTVRYLFNQDTGSRDIMAAFDQRGQLLYSGPIRLEHASQLLVYYWQ